MPYRAAGGGGMFGSSSYPDSRPQVDVAGALDSLTTGASSLIRQAYQRRLAQNELAVQTEARNYQRQRDVATDAQSATEFAYRQKVHADDLDLRRTEANRKFMEEGGIPERTIPAHTEAVPTPTVGQVGGFSGVMTPLAPPSATRRVMASARRGPATPSQPAGGPPRPSTGAAVAAPAPSPTAPLPASRLTSRTVAERTIPESFDATQSAKNVLAEERASETAARDQERAASQQAIRESANATMLEVAKVRAKYAKQSGTSSTGKAMTANKMAEIAQAGADALIGKFNGSLDDAVKYLETLPESDRQGITSMRLLVGRNKYVNSATGQALRLESGVGAASPSEAASTVKDTREIVGGSKKPTLDESALSDADLWEQKVKAGMSKDSATAYVKSRKKPPAGKK